MFGFLQINIGYAILHRCVLSVCDTKVTLDNVFTVIVGILSFMKQFLKLATAWEVIFT